MGKTGPPDPVQPPGVGLTHEHKLNGNAQVSPSLPDVPVFVFQDVGQQITDLINDPKGPQMARVRFW